MMGSHSFQIFFVQTIPSLLAALGLFYSGFKLLRGYDRKFKKENEIWQPVNTKFLMNIPLIDWIRILFFLGPAIYSPLLYSYEVSHWPIEVANGKGLSQWYTLIEVVVYDVLIWVLCSAWIVFETNRCQKESVWIRAFASVSLLSQLTCFWLSHSVFADNNNENSAHEEFEWVKDMVAVGIKLGAAFTITCFLRDWRLLRKNCTIYTAIGDGSSEELETHLLSLSSSEEEDDQIPLHDRPLTESQVDKLHRTPEQSAGLFSRLTLHWIGPVLQKGSQGVLKMQDFYKILEADDPEIIIKKFCVSVDEVMNSGNSSSDLNTSSSSTEQDTYVSFYDSVDEIMSSSNSLSDLKTSSSTEEDMDVHFATVEDDDISGDEPRRGKNRMWKMIKAMHRGGILTEFYKAGFFKILYDTTLFLPSQILKRITLFLNSEESLSTGLFLAFAMFFVIVGQVLLLQTYFRKVFRSIMRIRGAFTGLLFRKSMALSMSARQKTSPGEIINLVSTDVDRVANVVQYLHTIWSSPYQIMLSMIFLWIEVRYAALIALGFLCLFLGPSSGAIQAKCRKIEAKLMSFRDKRLKATSELLSTVKTLKMYGWLEKFSEKVHSVRNDELIALRRYVKIDALAITIWGVGPVLVALVTFASHMLLGGKMDGATVFTSVNLLDLLRKPLTSFPSLITQLAETAVSLRRLYDFLESSELNHEEVAEMRRSLDESKGFSVEISNGNYYWDESREKIALKNLNLKIKEGSFTVITGEIGSGKSAFMHLLAGELTSENKRSSSLPFNQQTRIFGTVSFSAQVPWIKNATVRDNILFGLVFDRAWYDRVVWACSLLPDFKQLPDGDSTLIGEKGINLSGGQKTRISLARAVYSRSDLVLLESCFESVDEHVSAFLLEHCFNGILAELNPITGRKRTVVLVTHALQHVHHADEILVFKNGQIVQNGSYDVVTSEKDSEFNRLAQGRETAATKSCESAAQLDKKKRSESIVYDGEEKKQEEQAREQEVNAFGRVKLSVYESYVSAIGGLSVFLVIFFGFVLENGLNASTAWWLAIWTSNNTDSSVPQDQNGNDFNANTTKMDGLFYADYVNNASEKPNSFYLGIYSVLSLSDVVVVSLMTLYFSLSALNASKVMHSNLLNAVTRAPMSFFDTTPIGRIQNRFSRDICSIDERIPDTLYGFLNSLVPLFGAILPITWMIPSFLVVVPFLFLGFMYLNRYYVSTIRQVKRWDSLMRSPIFSHFTESLEGVSTIRAFSMVSRFNRDYIEKLRASMAPFYLMISLVRWLAIRITVVGAVAVLVTNVLVVLFFGKNQASFGALALTYALRITDELKWTTRLSAAVETEIVAVERVDEYVALESEGDDYDPNPTIVPPEKSWPSRGDIVFENVCARYRPELPDVLHNVSFMVKSGEKIGIVGRTGSGKSSAFLVLLRLITCNEGRIFIDGYDINFFGLKRLRQSIAIIPQDPVLFSATIRYNLDPYGSFSDEEIWKALDYIHLSQSMKDLSKTDGTVLLNGNEKDPLDFVIQESGSNLSFGQRQLLCVARALLRNCKIVLLDEATSGIDSATDSIIQKTITTGFSDVTVLTIAHRLNTIMASQKILVIDAGRVVEFDSPETLLKNPQSQFYQLAQRMNERTT